MNSNGKTKHCKSYNDRLQYNKKAGDYMNVLRKEEIYTIDDIYALPDGERAELIDRKYSGGDI